MADAGGIDGPPVVIGHSMGGFVTIATAACHAERARRRDHLRLTGHRARPRDRRVPPQGGVRSAAHLRDRSTRRSRRFRTVPAAGALPRLRDRPRRPAARCAPVDGGWQWKFDRRVFEQFGGGHALDRAAVPRRRSRCRLALLRSEHGLVTEDIGASMYEQLGRVTPVIEIPEAGHHAMLDQPLSCSPRSARCSPTGTTVSRCWRSTPCPVRLAELALEQLARRVAGQRVGEVDRLRQLVAGEVLAGERDEVGLGDVAALGGARRWPSPPRPTARRARR